MKWLPLVVSLFPVTAIFACIGFWALLRKTPMHFWAGDNGPDPSTITNIPRFNRANAFMWFGICLPFIAAMIVSPFHFAAAVVLTVAGSIGCVPFVFIVHFRILKKYGVRSQEAKAKLY